jgi:small multidrug resistance family-3 protein
VKLIVKSLLVFIWAGLFELGGGYLIWQWLRNNQSIGFGLAGGLMLAFYGVIATFQPANFGRVYAAYGGIFIVMAMLWGCQVDKIVPDRYDIIGSVLAVLSVLIIMFTPRT